MTRVVLATFDGFPGGYTDDTDLAAALTDRGIDARWQVWGEPVDADLVVLRSTWDYTWRVPEFLAWCATVPRLANPLPVVEWNTDKAYLLALADAGVPVVPTELLAPGERPTWPSGEFVLKPSVGAGARGFGRFTDHVAAAEHLEALHAAGKTAMLQPFLPSVAAEGEVAMVYFAGVYSHAFAKSEPAAEPINESGLRPSTASPLAEPEPAYRALADDALDAAAALLGLRRKDLLYARVDVVRGSDDKPVLLELELVEPNLGFAHADLEAVGRFAEAIAAS